jgi:hypothetical protein
MIFHRARPTRVTSSPTFGKAAGVVSTARIERPPFYRGGSASTETMPAALPSSPSNREICLSFQYLRLDLVANSRLIYDTFGPLLTLQGGRVGCILGCWCQLLCVVDGI